MRGMGADAFFGPPIEAEEEQQNVETAKQQTGITVEPDSGIPESLQNENTVDQLNAIKAEPQSTETVEPELVLRVLEETEIVAGLDSSLSVHETVPHPKNLRDQRGKEVTYH